MINCSKRNCTRRRFMDTDRCFDHQLAMSPATRVAFVLYGIFSVLVALAVLGVCVWAVIELVQWVTSK